ncbi:cytochrome-c peroxidase [Pontibacter oryzae]|uniref:Cytochrome-c peroxidase n=1 Tax=Pontibacter oryzae TaxID=2304593 RepID=A0A399RU01_9BACT|nr:cytochrome c peroxidase [Pontibacter oryzae]RIJ33519.1 cytochrome-c peroxidase [Pontibacter oryzae]
MPCPLRYIAILGLSLLLTACDEPASEAPAPQTRRFSPAVPANLASAVPYPERNPFTVEGVELGRMLFYDPILSVNNQVSCASCHQQGKAFSDGTALSVAGVTGNPLKRHAPALLNLAWMDGLFWDGGAKDIESLVFGPITHPDEMGQDLKALASELQQHPKYPGLFRLAFGSDSITSARIARALAQFQRTLISANSRYDKYVRQEAGGQLSGPELQGLALFKQHCASCHTSDFFTDQAYHNNGLDAAFSAEFEELAFGRGRITRQQQDIGKYKTPTLRNIALTAPYMHDGRFATLDEVVEHYRTGVVSSPSLAPELKQPNGQLGIPITKEEKEKIILFLNTLTDEDFVHNQAFTNPF